MTKGRLVWGDVFVAFMALTVSQLACSTKTATEASTMQSAVRPSGEWKLSGVALGESKAALTEALKTLGGEQQEGDPDSFQGPDGRNHVRRSVRVRSASTEYGPGMVLVILLDDRVLSVMLGLSQEPPRDALTGGFGPAALSYEGGGLWYDAQTRRALELRHEEQGWVLQLSDYRALVDSGMMSQSAFEANLSRLPAGSR